MDLDRDAMRRHAQSVRADIERRLKEFVNIPSVSADPARKPDVARQVDAAVETLRAFGATDVEVVPTDGSLVVFARFLADAAAPTLGVDARLTTHASRLRTGRAGTTIEKWIGPGS